MTSTEKKKKRKTTKKKKKKASHKQKKKSLSLQATLILSLPDDLLLSCFARVSKLYYPILSLVSKRFRSLIASPELRKVRSSLDRDKTCLYVCLQSDPDTNPHWYTLCLKPNRTLNNGSSGNVLVPTPSTNCVPEHWSGQLSSGLSGIFNIGGPISFLDCPSHTLPEDREMWVECGYYLEVNVLNRKIYVGGGHYARMKEEKVFKNVVEKNVLGLSNGLAYKAKGGQWERFWGWKSVCGWFSFCVIENVLYHYRSGELRWYDTMAERWMKLKGLEGLPKIGSYDACVQLVDYCGKMAVLWSELCGEKKMIWCAVIALDHERCNFGEIQGEVEWCDSVLTVPKSYELEYALAGNV